MIELMTNGNTGNGLFILLFIAPRKLKRESADSTLDFLLETIDKLYTVIYDSSKINIAVNVKTSERIDPDPSSSNEECYFDVLN